MAKQTEQMQEIDEQKQESEVKFRLFAGPDPVDLRERDANLPTPRPTWLWLLAGSGWTADDGPAPGVFAWRVKGHQSLSSCMWASRSYGLLSPERFAPLDTLSSLQLFHEARDVVHRAHGDHARRLSPLVLDYLEGGVTNHGAWLDGITRILAEARLAYPEYTFVPDVPLVKGSDGFGAGRLVRLAIRPGWANEREVLASLGG